MTRWGDGGPQPTTGDEARAQCEDLNRRLMALGIVTSARLDKSPRLHPDDWEKLVTLAERGQDRPPENAAPPC